MIIDAPYCDWVSLANKDKRKAKIWLCKECGYMTKRMGVPACPCKPIVIPAAGQSTP